MHVEQVLRAEGRPTREGHQTDTGRLVDHLGRPERDDVLAHGCRLALLDLAAGDTRLELVPLTVVERAPLKVHHPLDLDRLLAEEPHRRHLIHRNLLARRDTAEELLVGAPLEHRPHDALLSLRSVRAHHRERAEKTTRHDLPHRDRIPLVVLRKG